MIELISLIWIFFGTLIGQAIIICVGYTFLFFFPKSKEFPSLQKFAISYGLGIGLLVFSMFLFILIGIHSRISFIPLLIISSILFLYFKIYKNLKDDLNIIFNTIRNWITRQRKINNVEIFCLILLIVTFLFLLYNCITLPFFADDPLGFWNPKALYIFFDGNFNYINYN